MNYDVMREMFGGFCSRTNRGKTNKMAGSVWKIIRYLIAADREAAAGKPSYLLMFRKIKFIRNRLLRASLSARLKSRQLAKRALCCSGLMGVRVGQGTIYVAGSSGRTFIGWSLITKQDRTIEPILYH